MLYPVYISKNESAYIAITPDLQNCKVEGKSIEDAILNITPAIEGHLETLIEEGRPLPVPQSIDNYLTKPAFNNPRSTWVMVEIDLSKLTMKPKRINITVPERLLKIFDNFAEKKGLTRSGFLAQAANDYINRELSV